VISLTVPSVYKTRNGEYVTIVSVEEGKIVGIGPKVEDYHLYNEQLSTNDSGFDLTELYSLYLKGWNVLDREKENNKNMTNTEYLEDRVTLLENACTSLLELLANVDESTLDEIDGAYDVIDQASATLYEEDNDEVPF
jgi:hypothetical protein